MATQERTVSDATIDAVVAGYREAAEWCEVYDFEAECTEDVRGDGYDWHPAAAAGARDDVLGFLGLLGNAAREAVETDAVRAGRDFLLTRNRHGAGFWDGDWPKTVSKELTDVAHSFGSQSYALAEHEGQTVIDMM